MKVTLGIIAMTFAVGAGLFHSEISPSISSPSTPSFETTIDDSYILRIPSTSESREVVEPHDLIFSEESIYGHESDINTELI